MLLLGLCFLVYDIYLPKHSFCLLRTSRLLYYMESEKLLLHGRLRKYFTLRDILFIFSITTHVSLQLCIIQWRVANWQFPALSYLFVDFIFTLGIISTFKITLLMRLRCVIFNGQNYITQYVIEKLGQSVHWKIKTSYTGRLTLQSS